MNTIDVSFLIAVYAIVFFISIFIIRAIFQIPTIVNNMKAQTTLLAMLVRKDATDEEKEKVKKIMISFGLEYQSRFLEGKVNTENIS